MPQPIRAAIFGTGHGHSVGKLRVLQESGDWELAGVCEPDDETRAQRQREPAWARVRWLEEAELLEDSTIRMVAVESEVPQLLALAQKTIAGGKHMHLDKPAGTDLGLFRRILEDARGQGLIVQMGYMFRYNTGFDLIRRAVGEGWLGRVHYVHGCINNEIRPEARGKLSFHPGGMMLELGGHLIDMLVLLMGRPERVTPFLRHDGRAGDGLADNTLAVFEFPTAVATIESTAIEFGAFPRRQFEVCGEHGSIVLQPLEPPAVRLCLREPRDGYATGWQQAGVENIPRYVRDLDELGRCIRARQPLPYSYDHDYTVQETILRACGAL